MLELLGELHDPASMTLLMELATRGDFRLPRHSIRGDGTPWAIQEDASIVRRPCWPPIRVSPRSGDKWLASGS